MKKNNSMIKNLTFAAVVAAVYVLLTTLNPVSYGFLQFRISEMICIMPLFNRKFIPGCLLGVAIANFFSTLGYIDVFIGLLIVSIAYFVIFKIKRPYLSVVLYSLTAATLVALEIYLVASTPYWISFTSVALSQLVITFIAVPVDKKIVKLLEKNNLI